MGHPESVVMSAFVKGKCGSFGSLRCAPVAQDDRLLVGAQDDVRVPNSHFWEGRAKEFGLIAIAGAWLRA
jgi:hypothetical protein